MGNDSYGLTNMNMKDIPVIVGGVAAANDHIIIFDSTGGGSFKRRLAPTTTQAEDNILAGCTATTAELNASTDVSLNAGVFKSAKIAFGATELSGSEVATSFVAPAGGMILLPQTAIFVSDAESGTMDVGTQGASNDPDGIFDAIVLTNTGWVFPSDVHTTGSNTDYLASTTRGALLYDIEIGSDLATDAGYANYVGSFITAADPISITSSGDLNSCSGFILLYYIELPTIA